MILLVNALELTCSKKTCQRFTNGLSQPLDQENMWMDFDHNSLEFLI